MQIIRSWLIAPANRPRFLAKFPTTGADVSVIDLEDGTPEQHKLEERERLPDTVRKLRESGLDKGLHVRVNHPRSEHYLADLEAAGLAGVDGVSIPKTNTVAEVRTAVDALAAAEQRLGRQIQVICGIESALGVLNVSELAFSDPRMIALYFGSEDFVTDMLGARRTPGGNEVLYARSRIVLAAKAARVGAIDQSVLQIRDDALFEKDSREGRDLGFDGKICLNPTQTALANRIFGPTPDEVDFSRRLLAAAHQAESEGIGTIDFEGRMIDGPLIKRCQHILAMAGTTH